jgi:hypothetical protein
VNAAYIGQTLFVTSGSSSTTAQVTLQASIADPDGSGTVTAATATFTDLLSNKVLATGVRVSPVSNSDTRTGTASTTVTLSSGQYGTQPYLIQVRIAGSYTNIQQTGETDHTSPAYLAALANVTVMIPQTINSTQGTGSLAGGAVAGKYAAASGPTYTMGLKYNNKGTSPQGQIQLILPMGDATYYVKSNSISSLAFGAVPGGSTSSKDVTVYTKASIYKILDNGQTVGVDGGVSLRVDAHEGCLNNPCSGTGGDTIGFTVMSSKDSALYFSNNWAYASDTRSWRTIQRPVSGTCAVVIN